MVLKLWMKSMETKNMLQHNNLLKEQTTLVNADRGATHSGGSFFYKGGGGGLNSKDKFECELCYKKSISCLTPVNFSKMVWIQGETLQFIYKNENIKKLEISLCYSCLIKLFYTSIPAIRFSQKLFEVLSGGENDKDS